MKAIAQSTGRSMNLIKADYRKCGDLGTVAKVWVVGNGERVFSITVLTV